MANGAQSLSDTELLAIFLRCGSKHQNVLELSTHILEECGGIRPLLHSPLSDLKKFKGLGVVKWTQLQAVYELVRRSLSEALKNQIVMDSPSIVREYLQSAIGHLSHEVFGVMFLDSLGKLIEFKVLFRGTIHQTVVHPKEIIKEAILLNAFAMIICHNHPNGDAHPSQADIELTNTLVKIFKMIEINILDHCIVSPNDYFSFYDAGLINTEVQKSE